MLDGELHRKLTLTVHISNHVPCQSGRLTRRSSVEIDPDLAEHARRALKSTGYPVTVITADGTQCDATTCTV